MPDLVCCDRYPVLPCVFVERQCTLRVESTGGDVHEKTCKVDLRGSITRGYGKLKLLFRGHHVRLREQCARSFVDQSRRLSAQGDLRGTGRVRDIGHDRRPDKPASHTVGIIECSGRLIARRPWSAPLFHSRVGWQPKLGSIEIRERISLCHLSPQDLSRKRG